MAPTAALVREQPDAAERRKEHRMVLWLILGFWAFHYLLLTTRMWLLGAGGLNPIDVELRRIAPTVLAVVICFGIYRVLKALADAPFALKVAAATALVLPAAALYSVSNDFVQLYLWPTHRVDGYTLNMLWTTMFPFIGSFAACTALVLALIYSFDVGERERRLSQIGIMAREAQLVALRYQLNPHFLFNTLNSISSMMWQNEIGQAEAMIVRLSEFLRKTLEVNPVADVILLEEIELQRLYLAIEEIRFADRLDVHFDIAESVANARVPSLIIQPLVENALRYAVATSPLQTRLDIRAKKVAGRLVLEVEDDGRSPPPEAPGRGVGLNNVRARILAHFGPMATMLAGPRAEGGFRVTLDLPLELVAR